MSNDPVRLTFDDGTILYTVGDGCAVQTGRLHDTSDEAWAAYRQAKEEWPHGDYYEPISENELALARVDEEYVTIETRYGAPGWKEMLTWNCKASKTSKIITEGPDYGDQHGY